MGCGGGEVGGVTLTRERLSSLEEKEVLAAGAASVGGFQPLPDPPGPTQQEVGPIKKHACAH